MSRLWLQADRLTGALRDRFIIHGFPQVLDPFIAAAGDLAATWFEDSTPGYVAEVALPPPPEKLEKSAHWGVGDPSGNGRERLNGTTQRAIFAGARDTTVLNAEVTGASWARYAAPGACEFCQMMAISGARYESQLSALRVVGRGMGRGKPHGAVRGNQALGEKYHDDCKCVAIEVPSGTKFAEPEHYAAWKVTYEKARAEAGKPDAKSILSAWRKLDLAAEHAVDDAP